MITKRHTVDRPFNLMEVTKQIYLLNELRRAHKKIAAIEAWENSKKASLEAELKKIEV